MRQARVAKLAEHLKNRLSIFTEAARSPEDAQVGKSFKEKCRLEAEWVVSDLCAKALLMVLAES